MTDSSAAEALRPNWFHILVALAATPMHGSAIARDVMDQTDGALRLWPATLYRTLDDMVEAGLIRELDGGDRPDDVSGRRRVYAMTPAGTSALEGAAERMTRLAGTARRRLRDASA